jgi:DNA transformation protein
MARTEFTELVEDLLQPVGPVEVRSMFGGHGVFLDGVMFGLIADAILYLKVDDVNRAAFEQAELEPFVYGGRYRPMTMPYQRAPEPLDDWDALHPWVSGALDAARRAAATKPRRPGKLR